MNSGYAVALILTAIPASIVATMAMRRIKSPGAPGLAAAMVAVMVWTISYALSLLSADFAARSFWLDMTYLGVVTVPTAFLFVAVQATKKNLRFAAKFFLLASIEPALTILILFTDRYHGMFYAGRRTSGSILNGGPWFWFNAVYLYAILAAALFALIRSLKHARDLYRRQILTLIAGMSLPWLGNVFSLTGLSPFGDLDLTPFFFFLSGTVIALGLFRYRFLDIVPVARELLVESMSDGIIVVDGKRRVVDINPATKKILGIDEGIIGKPVSEIRELDSGSCKLDLENPGQSGECFAQASPGRSFEFTVSMLKDGEKRAKGWLILLHDITERKKFEEELRRKGSHDTLTGLYNRQHYEEVMTELEAPGREAVSIIMIDLDGLKDINDAWGHAAGDDIIRETASILQETVGSDDILARAGGDEFLIIMPDTYAVEASERVDAIRRRIRARNAAKPGRPDIGISMGLAGRMVGESLATTLKRADDAMYAEKYRKKDIRSRLGRFGSPDTPPPSR